jgi:nucleoside-diphosphate-sugar epimerase
VIGLCWSFSDMESLGEVLIIGVNGFLGRCLSSGLSLRGATVSGFSRTGDAQSCNCEHFFAGSVLDLPRLKEVIVWLFFFFFFFFC